MVAVFFELGMVIMLVADAISEVIISDVIIMEIAGAELIISELEWLKVRVSVKVSVSVKEDERDCVRVRVGDGADLDTVIVFTSEAPVGAWTCPSPICETI